MPESESKPGRFLWPVSREAKIAAPAASVWRAISQPGNLDLCHPFCASNTIESWPGAGSIDRIRYLSGLEYERRFCKWIEGVGYDLEIYREASRQARVEWRISSIDDQNSALRITVYPEALRGKSAIMQWLAHRVLIRSRLSTYLDSVVRGFEWYIMKGEAVPRNQFGRHRWYS